MNIEGYGGSFDCPHYGHLDTIEVILARAICDELRIVPTRQHPFGKQLSQDFHRVAMLEMLVSYIGDPRVRIDTYELDHEGPSTTYQTLCAFKRAQPENNFAWIIGADNVINFHKWECWEDLLRQFIVYVNPRNGYEDVELRPGMVMLAAVDDRGISSSLLRKTVKEGKSIRHLTLPTIADYIEANLLYLE